jgi:murein DD-endopeptidase MepM/ murein hydrolase activator NlpD
MMTWNRVTLGAVLLLCMTACGHDEAQSSKSIVQSYISPIDYDMVLAGNFGEPRPYHFHGGLDIKTDNQEGKKIHAIADGYVSRLTVGMYGFGNALYVSHPDGKTSVYCHLKCFAEPYEAQLQRTGHDTLSMFFPETQFPVKAGDVIAISGNTGNSTGPHLHLELHDTETWVLRDPYAVMAQYIADTVAPQAHSFMAVPQGSEGVFNGGYGKQSFGFGQSDKKVQSSAYKLQREFTAWGRVGFALWADDYAETTYNHYGIRSTRLLVDGREVFRSEADSIPVSCQMEVNQWGDYQHWRQTRIWYMKSYREPGMRLPILETDFNRGIVNFCEERPYHLIYILRDYQGNESRYAFTVRGVPDQRIKIHNNKRLCNDYLYWQQCLWPRYTLRPVPTSL